jgi:4a-hydroxytetrahydrobiopterin dehydratase
MPDTKLADRRCEPCKPGTPPVEGEALQQLSAQLEGWSVVGGDAGSGGAKRLEKQYKFPDFRQALAFVNRVGEIAEAEGHHPDIELGWGRVKLVLWTHSIGGLSEGDFILAAKADRALTGH